MSERQTAGKGVAMEPTGSTTFQVSVFCCKKNGRVLFLEAGKDFVDTLLSFLLLPVGTIIHLLSQGLIQEKPLGDCGMHSIFESVKNLDSSLLHVDKQNLMEPRPAAVGTCKSTGLLQGLEAATTPSSSTKKLAVSSVYYRCINIACTYISTKLGARCNKCYGQSYIIEMSLLPEDLEELEAEIERVADADKEDNSPTGPGFVRETITYIVTDSLEIMPSTTIRSIKMLNKLKVATLDDLESSDTTVSITQVLELLQSAMTSNSCLNEVFGKQGERMDPSGFKV